MVKSGAGQSDLQCCHWYPPEVTQIENMLPEPPRIRWGAFLDVGDPAVDLEGEADTINYHNGYEGTSD